MSGSGWRTFWQGFRDALLAPGKPVARLVERLHAPDRPPAPPPCPPPGAPAPGPFGDGSARCRWGGGSDYLVCTTCGLSYDYRTEPRPDCPRQGAR